MNSRNRVGPYTVQKGYRGLGEGSGRVYEAVNVETGAPAVVVAPGPSGDWQPEADWAVRATAATHPPHLVLEVERAPDGGQLPELTLMLHRLAGAASRLEGRPDAAAHLGRRPQQVARRRRRPHRVRAPLFLALWAPCFAAVWLWGVCGGTQPATEISTPVLADLAAPELLSAVPDVLPVSGAVDVGGIIGRDMPKQPFPGQKRSPCTPRSQVEINGACWMVLELKPPCPEDVVEHGGKCYVPVFTAPPVPSSILR